jgi:2-keto-3-deoxy-L-rhamnonate aldolase RhmA
LRVLCRRAHRKDEEQMTLSLRQKLYQDQHALGFSLGFPTPGAIECTGAGWDWVWIDGQHGRYDYRGMVECGRAADACGLASIVRTSGHE